MQSTICAQCTHLQRRAWSGTTESVACAIYNALEDIWFGRYNISTCRKHCELGSLIDWHNWKEAFIVKLFVFRFLYWPPKTACAVGGRCRSGHRAQAAVHRCRLLLHLAAAAAVLPFRAGRCPNCRVLMQRHLQPSCNSGELSITTAGNQSHSYAFNLTLCTYYVGWFYVQSQIHSHTYLKGFEKKQLKTCVDIFLNSWWQLSLLCNVS